MRFDRLGSISATAGSDGIGDVGRMRMHAAAHIQFSEMMGDPEWYRAGTTFAVSNGTIPPIISVADDLRMLENIVENMGVVGFVDRILEARVRLLGRSGLLVVYHAPTLRDGVDVMVEAINRTNPYLHIEKTLGSDFVAYKLRPVASVGSAWPIISTVFALTLQQCVSVASHDKTNTLRIDVSAPPATDLSQYQHWFQCEVRLGCAEFGVAIPLDLAEQPNSLAEAHLWAIACQRLDVMAQVLDTSRERALVRAFVRESLLARSCVPTIKEASAHLRLSERTLIRKLANIGTSYRDLVDEERKARALLLIINQSLSIPNIADLLGFPDRSVFGRKFRNWTAQTPAAYRAKHVPGISAF